MKKLLAILLCFLTALGLLPAALPDAQAFTLTTYDYPATAYVGETLTWKIFILGQGPFEINYEIYKDEQLIDAFGPVSDQTVSIKAESAGIYKLVVTIRDTHFNDTETFNDVSPTVVTAWTTPLITGLETVNGKALKVSWAPVKGARQYELYRATNKAGPYKLVKATAATSLTNAYLTAGTRYFYKVRFLSALGNWSPFSNYITGVPIARAAIRSVVSPASRQVRLLWSKAAGAGGYQVLFSSAPAGPYRVVRTLNGTSAAFSGLRKGSRLYFQVRPYRKIYTTVYYGAVSAYRAVMVK